MRHASRGRVHCYVGDAVPAEVIEGSRREDDTRACWVAGFCVVCSAAFIIAGSIVMFQNPDQRLTLTTLEPFHDWEAVMGIFRGAVAYDPRFNPPTLTHARFVSAGESLQVVKDLNLRGLISDRDYVNVSALYNQSTGLPFAPSMVVAPAILLQLASLYEALAAKSGIMLPPPPQLVLGADPRLLARLLSASGCSFPDALDGATPVSRSPGCQCVGDAYVAFVLATGNMTSNVTVAARDSGVSDTLRCLDRRMTWRSWGVGHPWSIFPLGLAVYANSVLFLLCAAFLLSFNHAFIFPGEWSGERRIVAIKVALFVLTVGLGSIFVARDWRGNLFQIIGLCVVLWNLLLSANGALHYPAVQADAVEGNTPHPLLVCFWLNIPLILPAVIGAVAVTGLVRDVFMLCTVTVMASLLGLVMQVSRIIPFGGPAC